LTELYTSVKWKVLIIRQNIKEGQLNFRVFFKDFADSQRVPFYAQFPAMVLLEKHDGQPPFSKRTRTAGSGSMMQFKISYRLSLFTAIQHENNYSQPPFVIRSTTANRDSV
jgi:hypothetical protein